MVSQRTVFSVLFVGASSDGWRLKVEMEELVCILGRTLNIHSEPFEVDGVARLDLEAACFWIPLPEE